ncbi:TPA: toll/interleukin-1 receptor domain-containing protein [Vibrio parahaemolyticus]|nr:toll/interleukin-1 receptor domain-containing protein [Vibrio parahaemolyticus]HCE4649535.1 toll/interleukin-1 receptor domain-containing protein [Vibrio parahaemolyticus]HCG8286578.1 toll/interleukin-1 receptor domain-containing protein [Vibrio parahaemolyticus]HCG8291767.1 toll/interleukin-1 receptor domain-containing protein [Vibrio parahaemolyticus]HCG8296990.1 toll/interleukin-1 receptor domain-containing protein [Vibrio parahaemolyticus]
MNTTVPKVFLSYSHDSAEHKQWVLDLATRLVNSGIDARLDAWSVGGGTDLPHFMETQLAEVDRVIMVCTENYVEKANQGTGGVGYEKMIVTSSLMSSIDDKKIIPIIRQKVSKEVPTFLKSKLYIDFSNDSDFEAVIDELMREIHGSPLYKKPELGNNPYQTSQSKPAESQTDKKLQLLKWMVEQYEIGQTNFTFYDLHHALGCSKIFAETYLSALMEQGMIQRSSWIDYLERMEGYQLTNKAKILAMNLGWVKEN